MKQPDFLLRRDFADEMGLGAYLQERHQGNLSSDIVERAALLGRNPYTPRYVAYYIDGERGVMTADGETMVSIAAVNFSKIVQEHDAWMYRQLEAGTAGVNDADMSINAAEDGLPPLCVLHDTTNGWCLVMRTPAAIRFLRAQVNRQAKK